MNRTGIAGISGDPGVRLQPILPRIGIPVCELYPSSDFGLMLHQHNEKLRFVRLFVTRENSLMRIGIPTVDPDHLESLHSSPQLPVVLHDPFVLVHFTV